MKKLILSALLLTCSAFAQEMVDRNDTNQIASTVKDLEVKQLLEQTSEFRDCRAMYPFNVDDTPSKRDDKIRLAQDCFKRKLSGKKAEELAELSDKLDLQSYDLVKSKNSKDIQKYLSDKMYQSMTGVNPNERDKKKLVESLKFNNKKHIDQKVFITLWKTQIVKNSLFQISNFCLTKLRKQTGNLNAKSFGDYWTAADVDNMIDKTTGKPNVIAFTDTGTPEFGSLPNVEDKTKIYEDLFNSLKVGNSGGAFPTAQLSNFFFGCGKLIVPLCEKFKSDATKPVDISNNTKSSVDNPSIAIGGSACLVKAKLEEYKKALADTDKFEAEFNKLAADNKTEQLMSIISNGSPKIFGKGANDESLDNLTNYTSKDFIDGGLEANDTKVKDCIDHPENPECEKQFLGDREEFLKAQTSVETEMTLKREAEMARVRDLKSRNDAKLDEYLEQNGFYEILKKYKNGDYNSNPDLLAEDVGKEFEAKKVAMLDEMQKKLGSRQLKQDATAQDKENAVKKAAQETKEERARLAQVVLFNNIITSNLSIERDLGNGKREAAGRNVNAFNKEAQALTNARVDAKLFQNLKAQGDEGNSQVGQNDQLGGIVLIEEMLGKEKK